MGTYDSDAHLFAAACNASAGQEYDASLTPETPHTIAPLMAQISIYSAQLKGQLMYYFSESNLYKDMYLRSKMDSEGWVDADVIRSFPRIQQICPDPRLLDVAFKDASIPLEC